MRSRIGFAFLDCKLLIFSIFTFNKRTYAKFGFVLHFFYLAVVASASAIPQINLGAKYVIFM